MGIFKITVYEDVQVTYAYEVTVEADTQESAADIAVKAMETGDQALVTRVDMFGHPKPDVTYDYDGNNDKELINDEWVRI